jgi:isoamylase/glycogen operon protein
MIGKKILQKNDKRARLQLYLHAGIDTGSSMNKLVDPSSILPGNPYPFGVTSTKTGFNFSIYAKKAKKVSLCLFDEDNPSQLREEIDLDPLINKTGEVWHILIQELPPSTAYAYRITNQKDAANLLLDPYARGVVSSLVWRSSEDESYRPLGRVPSSHSFDWEGDRFPRIPAKDLIIYEMHVRGFTQDQSSEVKYPGTFLGVVEKIPYLKELGVNAVELLPIHEFNESEVVLINPKTGQRLCNYFGYSSVNFFSPMNRYASESRDNHAILEFKTMVRELHKAGIEVILDVVYNHTFEGNEKGPVLSFRGFDPHAYYMVDRAEKYLNFSGCGNTTNTNHPITRELIIHSLRYWVSEMHVDGFRFDLASIFTRSENGVPLTSAPIVEAITADPILSETKMIAEAWDAGGLYQVGGFHPSTRWSEWNGRYRDVVRCFIKGNDNYKTAFATALCGSQDLYGWRGSPLCSVNFITAHDGFSLVDLVSYNNKHNLENGEENRDGFDHNDSWNCGIEGQSSNKKIVYLRERQMKNFIFALMVSQGIPMITMGDEYVHTRNGNNNTWCQDNERNWFLWDRLEIRPGFYRFYKSLLHFRQGEPLLKKEAFLNDTDITWHGTTPGHPDWDNDNHLVAFTLNDSKKEPRLYIAFNAWHLPQTVILPTLKKGNQWFWVVDTKNQSPNDFLEEGNRLPLEIPSYRLAPYSAIMLRVQQS